MIIHVENLYTAGHATMTKQYGACPLQAK